MVSGSGESKDYLIWLYKNGFPVIPSVDNIKDLGSLPATDEFFIKPQDGFSGINARKINKKDLVTLNPKHYVIQPFIDFEYEVSFYYLDKAFAYALYAPDKSQRFGSLTLYEPTPEDMVFADKYVKWNLQKRGLERVDACRTRDGKLLLTEMTDQGGAYLSILHVPELERTRFLEHLSRSLLRIAKR